MLLESKIQKVTVYYDRALIERVTKINLASGEHSLSFGGLPSNLDNNSIQVSGGKNCILQEIKVKNIYLDEIPDEQKKAIHIEIEDIESKVEERKDKIKNLSEEKQLLQKLVNLPSESTKKGVIPLLSPENVREMLSFFGEKMNQLDESVRTLKKELKKLEEKLHKLREQTKAYNKNRLKSEKQVDIKIFVQENTDVVLILSYVVMNANWRPVYDFRLDSNAKKLNISYNAIITQNTGEKWEEITLNLSTAQPQISAIQPELYSWFIDIYHPQPPSPKLKRSAIPPIAMTSVSNEFMKESAEREEAPMPIMEAKIETGASAVSFVIPGSHTISDNNEEHKVGISVLNFDASLAYKAVPKISQYAYLTATCINSSNFPMLAGEINVFLDNSFVTNSAIKLIAPNQEFKTSLGVDESVKIEHKLVNKFSKDEGLFSKKSKVVFEYLIAITNNKKIDCIIQMKDQIPISQNQEIKVELIEPKYKEDTPNLQKSDEGIIEWKFNIKPGEKMEAILKFSVEYRREIEIIGLE